MGDPLKGRPCEAKEVSSWGLWDFFVEKAHKRASIPPKYRSLTSEIWKKLVVENGQMYDRLSFLHNQPTPSSACGASGKNLGESNEKATRYCSVFDRCGCVCAANCAD